MKKLLVAAFLAVPSAALAADAPVTFTKDVAPILYKSCVECHRPTMFAPMSLMTYDEARPWARSIKQRVVAAHDAAVGRRSGARRVQERPAPVAEADIETIATWVDGGAPKGDDKDLPAAPKFVEGWTIGKPDAVFTMEEEFTIPADGAVPYQVLPRCRPT